MIKEGRLDTYLRRQDTLLAKTLHSISPKIGRAYRQGRIKRGLDIAIALPLAVATMPLVAKLKRKIVAEDGLPPLYTQPRVAYDRKKGVESEFTIRKLRSMHPGSDTPEAFGHKGFVAKGDTRVTKIGERIRASRADELPQLWQIVKGEMSMVGIRALHMHDLSKLRKERGASFESWHQAYLEGRPGLTNAFFLFDKSPHNGTRRYHWDIFYAKKASLGLDLYLLYKTLQFRFRKKHYVTQRNLSHAA